MSRSAELFGDATSVSVLDVFRLGCLIHHVIFKRDAFRIVLRKPCIGGVVGPRQANYYSMFANDRDKVATREARMMVPGLLPKTSRELNSICAKLTA